MDEVALLRDLYTATVTGILLGVVFALVLRDLEMRGKELVLPKPVYVVALLICAALALFGQSKLVAALSDRYLTIGFVGACTLLMWVGVWFLMRPLYVKDGMKHGAIAYSVGLFFASGGFVFAMGTGPQDSIRIMQYGTLILGISMPIVTYWLSMTYKIGKAVPAASQ